MPASTPITTAAVTSADGTRIGYRWLGTGPALVLVQGAMGTAEHFVELAGLLAGTHTVVLPDRRGRGLSPRRFEPGYQVTRDVEDLAALLDATGATDVFGLSSGAFVALEAARTLAAVRRVAAFEPPIFLDDLPADLLARFHREAASDDVPAMLITAMKVTRLAPRPVELVPRRLLELATRLTLALERRRTPGRYPPTTELAGALSYDFAIVEQLQDIDRFSTITADVLLIGGTDSPPFLRTGLDALSRVLPAAERVELAGVGHGAAWNADRRGRPQTVASALRRFFSDSHPS